MFKFTASFLAFALVGCVVANPLERRQTTCPTIPNLSSYNNAVLPDPFTFANGQPVSDLDDWACRQAEISTLIQQDELGALPPPPQTLTASFSGTTLTINATNSGKTISFSQTITYPSSGTAPFPAIIAIDGISFPAPAGVAVVAFNADDMALQNDATSRGVGKFFQLFGTNATAGAMMAWAWGVGRVVDALEMTPSARIDPTRLGVSGCSRDGKGALVAGAFEPRIKLTIPQESGSGGTDCWRISDAILKNGTDTQTASEIIQENVWFSTLFNHFAQTSVNALPFDHHLLAGLIAPRAIFVIDNLGYDWLGPFASWGCMLSARRIWGSLNALDNFGISQSTNHSHCVFPSSQQAQLNLFINKFLVGLSENTTNVVNTAGTGANYSFTTPGTWDPWAAPVLVSGTGSASTSTAPVTSTGSASTSVPVTTPSTTSTSTGSTGTAVPPAAHWGQCGGIGWTGATVCASPYTCQVLNPYYSQCL